MKLTPSIIPDSGLQSVVESFHKAPGDNPVQQVLRAALEHLDGGRNWCKFDFQRGHQFCARGALRKVMFGDALQNDATDPDVGTEPYRVLELACQQIHHRGFFGVGSFNNAQEDFAPIDAAFKLAITLAGQQVGV